MSKKMYKYIAQRLREKRKKVGFKLAYVASHLGISIKQLQLYESAKTKISASRLYQIGRFLGVSTDYFFDGINKLEKQAEFFSQAHIRPDRLRTLYILLIQDNESDVFITRKAFQYSSVPVEILVMNEETSVFNFLLKRTTEVPFPRPDLILLDLNLPKEEGILILHKIKQDVQLSDIPIVILSGICDLRVMVECYRKHAAGYIYKPLNFELYSSSIDILARYWAQAVVLPTRQLELLEE